MQAFFTILTLYGTFTILFGLISLFIKERLYISETVISTVFGIVIGEKGINVLERLENKNYQSGDSTSLTRKWLDPEQIMFYLSRLVISLQVVAVGNVVPYAFLKQNIKMVLFLIGPVMIITYLVSFIIIYVFTKNILPLTLCLVVAACVTPTDPVLASSILKGKFANRYIPRHLRNLLILEGGINDGLAYPLLTLPLFYIQRAYSDAFGSKSHSNNPSDIIDTKEVTRTTLFNCLNNWMSRSSLLSVIYRWISFTLVYEIVFACFYGLLVGYLSKKALLFSKKKNFIDKENDLSFLLGVSMMVTGTTGLLKSDDILACFFCGIAFSYTGENENTNEQNMFMDQNMRDEKFLEQTERGENFHHADRIETVIKIDMNQVEEMPESNSNLRNSQLGQLQPVSSRVPTNRNLFTAPNNNDAYQDERGLMEYGESEHSTEIQASTQVDQYPSTDLNRDIYNVQNNQTGLNRQIIHTNQNTYNSQAIYTNQNTYTNQSIHNNQTENMMDELSTPDSRINESPFKTNGTDAAKAHGHSFYEILDILINSVFFMIYGYFLKVDPKYLTLSITLLIFKRLPFFMALPLFRNTKERFFAGWYAPVGVGALFFFSHFRHELYDSIDNPVLTEIVDECEIIINTIVLSSVILHGTTAIVINLALRKKRKVEQEMYFVSESENEEL